jgi:hypothetical protein
MAIESGRAETNVTPAFKKTVRANRLWQIRAPMSNA